MAKPRRRSPVSGADALNTLGVRLLKHLEQGQPRDNLIFSPCSIGLCLAVAANGAGGQTREAIARALGVAGLSEPDMNQRLRALRMALEEAGPGFDLATAVLAVRPAAFSSDFVERVREFYGVEAGALDAPGPEAAAIINRWVSDKTGGRIPTLVASGDLSAGIRCLLTNAVHFKGRWAGPFDPRRTRPGHFALPDGRTREVSMMRRSGQHRYLDTSGFQAIELAYAGGRLGMYVFLPRERPSLDVSDWQAWLAHFESTPVELALPRAAAAYAVDLAATLGQLGLDILFGPGADFARMGLPGSFISAVKHRAEIEVTEEGTEASASTAMLMGRRLTRSTVMTVDRPFYLAIHDQRSDLLLFLGRIVDPDPTGASPSSPASSAPGVPLSQ